MPKSGIAKQVCPCGSGLRPHLALSIHVRSLHIRERVASGLETIYICPGCAETFRLAVKSKIIKQASPEVCEAILERAAPSIVAVWEEIGEAVLE